MRLSMQSLHSTKSNSLLPSFIKYLQMDISNCDIAVLQHTNQNQKKGS